MKFGPVPLAQARGAILAHSVQADKKIPKGTVLDEPHLAELKSHGITELVVAQLDPDDVHEDEAATRLGQALLGPGLEATVASTGRVNLRAEGPGVVFLDPSAINGVNKINPGITIATVALWTRLDTRGLAATVKIIPYSVPEADVIEACNLAQGGMSLKSPVLRSATLIETTTDDKDPSEKGRKAINDRLSRLGVSLSDRIVVPHSEAEIASEISMAPGELIMILTSSATSDQNDTAPASLREAGGQVDHYGMPVDPGNLLFVGHIGKKAVIGLPGCARSPALNGADWVLERTICGVPPSADEIMGMGVGGLLKEIPTRPRPRQL